MKLKLRIYEDFSKDNEVLGFRTYSTEAKHYNDSNKLVVGKMKDDAIKEFVGLKPKMYSFFVDDSTAHKKTKGMNKNAVATIIYFNFQSNQNSFFVKPKKYYFNFLSRQDSFSVKL